MRYAFDRPDLKAKIESISPLGHVVVSFDSDIDLSKTKISDFGSATLKICVLQEYNTSPFGDLCGTAVDHKHEKSTLAAAANQTEDAVVEKFCGIDYVKPKNFTWQVVHLRTREL